jgi:hypothetical protein
MTQDEFISALHSRKHTLPQLRRKLESLAPSERMAVLIRIFSDFSRPAEAFGDQEYAGRLLVDLRPAVTQDATTIIREIISTWNVSVEQLPIYLADVFGRAEIMKAASALRADFPSDSREHRALETLLWWIRGGDRMIPSDATNMSCPTNGEQGGGGNYAALRASP